MVRSKYSDCSASQARIRLGHAELYLDVARLVIADETGSEATVATGNAVLAGIAAADAICCRAAGERYRGADHREAARFLESVTGDRRLGAALRELADYKDGAHYGLSHVKTQRARAATRRAEILVRAAQDRM